MTPNNEARWLSLSRQLLERALNLQISEVRARHPPHSRLLKEFHGQFYLRLGAAIKVEKNVKLSF